MVCSHCSKNRMGGYIVLKKEWVANIVLKIEWVANIVLKIELVATGGYQGIYRAKHMVKSILTANIVCLLWLTSARFSYIY